MFYLDNLRMFFYIKKGLRGIQRDQVHLQFRAHPRSQATIQILEFHRRDLVQQGLARISPFPEVADIPEDLGVPSQDPPRLSRILGTLVPPKDLLVRLEELALLARILVILVHLRGLKGLVVPLGELDPWAALVA